MAGTRRAQSHEVGSTAELSVERLLEEAFRGHIVEIRRFFQRHVADAELAEDLAQEVFVEAVEWVLRCGGPESVERLLQSIATRRSVDLWRAHRVESLPLEMLAEAEDTSTPTLRISSVLSNALRALPPSERRVVAMRILQGCGFREIAGATHASEASCRMRYLRGVETLRAVLPSALAAVGLDLSL